MNIFHERVKTAMKQAKISQSNLAKMLGVTQATIWIWINKEFPSLERFYQICCTLKVSPNYLLGLDEENIES